MGTPRLGLGPFRFHPPGRRCRHRAPPRVERGRSNTFSWGASMEPLPETREALAEFVSLEEPDVDELLLGLGRDAERLVPELVGLSLGLVSEGLTFTLVASGQGIAAMDATQYLDGGPCVEVSEGRSDTLLARPDDPLDEERWELYSRMGAAAGVASSLSMPIYRRGRLIGGVNLYASTADAFSAH